MKIAVCIGSSCHLKGSRPVVETLQRLIKDNGLDDQVELSGRFCMGNCQNGVCLTLDEKPFSVSPETVEEFFKQNVLTAVTAGANGGR